MTVLGRILLVVSLAPMALATVAFADETANEALARRFYAEFNAHNLGALSEFMTSDFIDHNPAPGQKPGLAGLVELNEGFYKAFADIQGNVEIAIAEDDYVTTYITAKGTHTGDFFGSSATNKPVEFHGIDIWLVKDGKLTEVWHVEEILSILFQIGAIGG